MMTLTTHKHVKNYLFQSCVTKCVIFCTSVARVWRYKNLIITIIITITITMALPIDISIALQ